MVDYIELYAGLVRSGKITIDRVPSKYREAVRQLIEND